MMIQGIIEVTQKVGLVFPQAHGLVLKVMHYPDIYALLLLYPEYAQGTGMSPQKKHTDKR